MRKFIFLILIFSFSLAIAGPDGRLSRPISLAYANDTWSDNQANATTSVKIRRIGNRVFVTGLTTFTGAMSGAFSVTIGSAYAVDSDIYSLGFGFYPVGIALMRDSSASETFFAHVYISSSNLSFRVIDGASAYSKLVDTSATIPFTWASPDQIQWAADWAVQGWR